MESVLVIDKHVGPSSFDIVRGTKPFVPGLKIGHAGSLDPFATGVLVLLIGRATKLSNALLNADKQYHATMKLGESTDTADRTGTIVSTKPVPEITEETVRACLKGFEGVWEQTPPMYSAKKIRGVRLYELARNQIHVRRQPIPVQLHRLELKAMNLPFIEFEVECSKGTYVRSLAEEIGKALGTVAHLAELRRLSCGEFTLSESVTMERLAQDPAGYIKAGYHNYVKLLRAEGLIRSGQRPRQTSFANANQQW